MGKGETTHGVLSLHIPDMGIYPGNGRPKNNPRRRTPSSESQQTGRKHSTEIGAGREYDNKLTYVGRF